MNKATVHLWSAIAALQLALVGCAKGGQINQSNTPSGEANQAATPSSAQDYEKNAFEVASIDQAPTGAGGSSGIGGSSGVGGFSGAGGSSGMGGSSGTGGFTAAGGSPRP